MPCIDPEIFFFEQLPAGAIYRLTVTGPPGEFSVSPTFTHATTGDKAPLPTPPGTIDLPAAPQQSHGVNIEVFFATACRVKVEATCAGQTYCREMAGVAQRATSLLHVLRMA